MPLLDATIEILDADRVRAAGFDVPESGACTVRELVGDADADRAAALCKLQGLYGHGAVKVRLVCESPELDTLFTEPSAARDLCKKRPALWNVFAYEREWETHPEYNDFLQKESPVHQRKTFGAEIYADLLRDELSRLGPGSAVLDAGAGVGRMVSHLVPTGAALTLLDASPRALECAWRELCHSGAQRYDLHLRMAHDLSCFEDDSFDLVLALELLCYLDDPAVAAAELARVCRPGGVVAFSVENKPGAILGDSNLSAKDILTLLGSDELSVSEYGYTRYYTRDAANKLARGAGLQVHRIQGCHYIADGPLNALVSEPALADPRKRRRFHTAERLCRTHDPLNRLPRAWLVVAGK